MNIFKFLKSRSGALSKVGVVSLGLTVGLVGLNFYNYVSDSPAAQEQKVRDLAAIFQSGGQVPAAYSNINVSAGETRFATAEERAKYEGAIFDGGDAAEARLSGFNVQGRALGAGEAGLGMVGDAVEVGSRGAVNVGVGPDGSAVGAALQNNAQTKGGAGSAAQGPQLQRATIASASGSNLGSGAGMSPSSYGASGAQSSAAARSLKSESQSRVIPSISGEMPGGSTLVSSKGFQGAHASSYRGGSRGSQTLSGQGLNSSEGKGLRRIAVNSGKVAADKYRRANAGTEPIMNEEYQTPGLTVTKGDFETLAQGGVGDDSFEDEMNRQTKAFGDQSDEIDLTEQQKNHDRNRLWKTLVGLTCATFVAMVAIKALMDIAKGTGPYAALAMAGAIAVAAVMAVAIGIFVRDAAGYGNKYNEWGLPIGMFAGALVMVGGLAIAFIGKVNGWLKSVGEFFQTKWGGLVGSVLGTGATFGATQTVTNIKEGAIGKEDPSKLSND